MTMRRGDTAAHTKQLRRSYFIDELMELNLLLIVVPSVFTAAMMASAMPAAINPYSIAVAPDVSDRNARIR